MEKPKDSNLKKDKEEILEAKTDLERFTLDSFISKYNLDVKQSKPEPSDKNSTATKDKKPGGISYKNFLNDILDEKLRESEEILTKPAVDQNKEEKLEGYKGEELDFRKEETSRVVNKEEVIAEIEPTFNENSEILNSYLNNPEETKEEKVKFSPFKNAIESQTNSPSAMKEEEAVKFEETRSSQPDQFKTEFGALNSSIEFQQVEKEIDFLDKNHPNIAELSSETSEVRENLNNFDLPKKIYNDTKKLLEKIYLSMLTDNSFDFEGLKKFSTDFIHTILRDKTTVFKYSLEGDSLINSLIKLVFDPYDFNYIDHSANVAFLSLKLGLKMGYTEEKLNELFISCLLHDVGKYNMPKEIYSKPDALTIEEKDKIKILLKEAFDSIKGLSLAQNIFQIVFPKLENKFENFSFNKKENIMHFEFNDLSYIIGLTNIYEAITHTRPWRSKLYPYQVVESLLKSDELLYPKTMVKSLLMCFSIFPYGSFVRLNSKEIGKVISVNEDSPLKPVVEILLDQNKNKIGKKRIINIATESTFYITEFIPANTVEDIIFFETNVQNTASFMESLKKEMNRAVKNKGSFCLALSRLNNLEDLEITMGKEKVNSLIGELLVIIKNNTNQQENISRYQDNFIILFPTADGTEAILLVQKILKNVNKYLEEMKKSRSINSVLNVALIPFKQTHNVPMEELLEEAMKTLKKAEDEDYSHFEISNRYSKTM